MRGPNSEWLYAFVLVMSGAGLALFTLALLHSLGVIW